MGKVIGGAIWFFAIFSAVIAVVMLTMARPLALLMQSMSAFVAQNVGAGKEERARKSMLIGMAIGASIGVFICCFTFFRGDLLAYIFTRDVAVVARAAEYLKGFSLEAIVTSILFSFIGYYNGHSQTVFVMFQGLAQTFLVRLPMSYLMSIRPNASLIGIGLAAPAATIFGIVINVIFFVMYTKKMKKAAWR